MTKDEFEAAAIVHDRRQKVFEAEGLTPEDAWDLAEKMFDRDHSFHDPRRICFECTKYSMKDSTCPHHTDRSGVPKIAPNRFLLQQCGWFNLKGKKS